MNIIGAAAQLNSGKDVLCDHLVKTLNKSGGNWKRTAFANAVKSVFESSFDVDRDFIEAWKRNPEPPPGMLMNVRKSLQFIGDGFRKIKEEIWIEIALRGKDDIIISDSRYINEARSIKQRNGIMILLYRPGFLNDDPNPSEAQLRPIVEFCVNNLEEGQIPPMCIIQDNYEQYPEDIQHYDFFLVNDGTLEDLYNKVDRFLVPFIEYKLGAKNEIYI
jgi:uncharacterized protein YuzB (UPF0349 family)